MNSCLSLSENPLRFEPLRKMTTIFYDDKSNEIFTIIHTDVMQVIVENTNLRKKNVYTVKHKRHVISLKFSPDQRILAVQHDKNSIEFMSFVDGIQSSSFTQFAKASNSELLGFVWVSGIEVLFVTNVSLELYQVEYDKKSLKYLKNVSMNISWFLHLPKKNFILLCTGPNGIHLQPYYIQDTNFNKLPRLELDSTHFQKQGKPCTILERDVTLTSCYNQTRVLIFQHSQNGALPGTDIAVYTVSKNIPAKKTHVLKLSLCGRFALNIVDDLIVVHHQISKTSFIFDIGLVIREEDSVTILTPIIDAMPIKIPSDIECELYSPHWVTFQPNIIIDVGIGAFWYLNIDLSNFLTHIEDKCLLVDFLLQRTNGKIYLVKLLNGVMLSENKNLEEIAQLFNRLNLVYKDKLELERQSQVGLPVSSSITIQVYKPLTDMKIAFNQLDMYSNVFTGVADYTYKSSSQKNKKFFTWILLEYIRSLTDYNIPVQHCIHELLINTLVLNKDFQQLHQILQYHVIADSKPLACLLLSLENVYPPAHQLALDMLHRITNATEEITEVLLSKKLVISALRYSDAYGTEGEISYRKYLDIADSVGDPNVFYSVFVEFEKRDQSNSKGISQFSSGGRCDVYVQRFFDRYRKIAV
ncbi:hypothetical protein V9T40_014081 [Parthenolecanium corni]|uniref:Mic1 domain-containing protein n=1 Tax=Parthenolecanium corni TaxID=536013 RepID=A0AAN9TC24_9HEMI